MSNKNMIKKVKEETQHLVATQLLNDWEETLDNFLSGDKVSIKNISEVISYMRLLNQKTPIDKLIRIIDSKKYDIETKITIFLTLARFRKEGAELFRKVFSGNLANTFEIELKKYEQNHSRHQQILKYPAKMNNSKEGVTITAKQEKRARKIAAQIAKETKSLTYPQILKEWEDGIFKIYMYEDKILDELKDAIALMKIRQKEKNTNVIVEKIRGIDYQNYSSELLIKLLFTVAFFCKDGPELYRKVYGAKMPLSVEKNIAAIEHNHKVYEYEIDNGMSK